MEHRDFRLAGSRAEITPLAHMAAHRELPAEARLRCHQLYALCFNEQAAFFEREMLSPGLRALLRCRMRSR